MKQLLILLFLLTASSSVFAQKDSIYIWNKWCARRDTLLLFTASYNMIEVYSASFKPNEIYLKSLDKTLKISDEEPIGDTLTMLAMPYTTEKPMRLAIYSKKNNRIIKTVTFNGTEVPDPKARLGYLKDTLVPRVNILAQVGLKVYFPNSLYSYPYHVKEFGFKTHYDKTDVKLSVKGHLISKDIEQAINKVPVGTVIQFTDIKVTCPECVIRLLDDYRLKVK